MHQSQCEENVELFPLPKGWSEDARHAVLNVIGIVRVVILKGREFLIQNGNVIEAHLHRLETDVALLREELRIVSSRWARIDPHRRPQYPPIERMAILELRAMRGWSKAETARHFSVTDDTIRSWLRRVRYYNEERTHSGRICDGKTPAETFQQSKHLAEEKMIGQKSLDSTLWR